MNAGLSIYLDLLRLIAAMEVLLFHLNSRTGLGGHGAAWNAFGHEAVVIFFVLSGYVIRHAAEKRERNFDIFAASRLTRIYSVALPALFLTFLFDKIGIWLAPQIYDGLITQSDLLRLLLGGLFLNESWTQSVQMLSNTPYWSIAYEFWYYFIFASVFFFCRTRRFVLATLFCLIAGYKILLLFPIWVMGWLAYEFNKRKTLPFILACTLFFQPVAIFWAYQRFHVSGLGTDALIAVLGYEGWRNGLSWSRFVLSDTLLGFSLALHFIAAKRLGGMLHSVLKPIERPIRFGAGQSFTLYLLHQPAMLFCGAILYGLNLGPARVWAIFSATILIVLLVAHFTEGQRHKLLPYFEKTVVRLTRWLPGYRRVQTISGA